MRQPICGLFFNFLATLKSLCCLESKITCLFVNVRSLLLGDNEPRTLPWFAAATMEYGPTEM